MRYNLPMKIAIDARFYGSGHTGLGRYTTNVMKYLPRYLQGETLQVLLRDNEMPNYQGGKNVQNISAEIPHYSLMEQLKLPLLLKKLHPTLLYTFHFNLPLLASLPKIVTVHDLIKSHFTGSDTTTWSPWIYRLKRFGYHLVIKHTLTKANDIIVPSNTVKNDILALFPTVKPELIHVIPEAPDEIFRQTPTHNLKNLINLKDYLLYVGNVYPHKNLRVLLSALTQLPGKKLVIVAKPSPFLSRVLAPWDQTNIQVLSNLTDSQLVQIYQGAALLITPSLMEGYGLVGLESLMVGTPVVASNIPVYREVYGKQVTYFDPHSSGDLVRAIKLALSKPRPKPLTFPRTWDDVARDIAEVINARSHSL